MKEKVDDESYRLSDDEVKLEDIQDEVNKHSDVDEKTEKPILKDIISVEKIKKSSLK